MSEPLLNVSPLPPTSDPESSAGVPRPEAAGNLPEPAAWPPNPAAAGDAPAVPPDGAPDDIVEVLNPHLGLDGSLPRPPLPRARGRRRPG